MYKNCDNLVSINGFVLHSNITEVTGFIEGCDKLVNANNVTISGPFYNDIFRGVTSLKYVNNLQPQQNFPKHDAPLFPKQTSANSPPSSIPT